MAATFEVWTNDGFIDMQDRFYCLLFYLPCLLCIAYTLTNLLLHLVSFLLVIYLAHFILWFNCFCGTSYFHLFSYPCKKFEINPTRALSIFSSCVSLFILSTHTHTLVRHYIFITEFAFMIYIYLY